MSPVSVELPDGSQLELRDGASGADAAGAIGPRLAKDALAVKADGEVRDLAAALGDGERIEILTPGRPEALELLRHRSPSLGTRLSRSHGVVWVVR